MIDLAITHQKREYKMEIGLRNVSSIYLMLSLDSLNTYVIFRKLHMLICVYICTHGATTSCT